MGRRHAQNRRHRLPLRVLAGDRDPVGRDADDVRAGECAGPIALGEPAVVTDERADPAERRVEDWEPKVPGLEDEVLVTPQVDFAELAEIAVWAENGRTVEQLV